MRANETNHGKTGEEDDVCGKMSGGKKVLWPRFGQPLLEPLNVSEPVSEEWLTWLKDLEEADAATNP